MKKILLLSAGLCALMTGFAQDEPKEKPDTIKVGGMVIIREKGKNNIEEKDDDNNRKEYHLTRRSSKRGVVTTNWIIPDIGFSNYNDQTNYSDPAVKALNAGPGPVVIDGDWFKLRPISSVNFNLWLFMQRISLAKRVVNFKYGLGVEFNNYRLEDKTVRIGKNPFEVDQSYPSTLKKNKLGASYITMPFMLNFNFTPNKKQTYGFSTGVSVGYLYRAYQKTKEGSNKNKTKGLDFDTWKISYVGEVSLGIVHLYGSYAMESLFTKDQLNMTPYTVGFRFSNW